MAELSRKLVAKPGAEVLVFFTTRRVELERRFGALKETLGPADGLWIAWPKKAARLDTDLDFDAPTARERPRVGRGRSRRVTAGCGGTRGRRAL